METKSDVEERVPIATIVNAVIAIMYLNHDSSNLALQTASHTHNFAAAHNNNGSIGV